MSQRYVYEQFQMKFPQMAKQAATWFPCGKNRVRIRMVNNQDFIFTFNGKMDWRLETVDSFLNQTKGE